MVGKTTPKSHLFETAPLELRCFILFNVLNKLPSLKYYDKTPEKGIKNSTAV
jgi:hypothetical protein